MNQTNIIETKLDTYHDKDVNLICKWLKIKYSDLFIKAIRVYICLYFLKLIMFPYRAFKYGWRDWNACCCYKEDCNICVFFKEEKEN